MLHNIFFSPHAIFAEMLFWLWEGKKDEWCMKQKLHISKENSKYILNILQFAMSTIIPMFDCIMIICIFKLNMRRDCLKRMLYFFQNKDNLKNKKVKTHIWYLVIHFKKSYLASFWNTTYICFVNINTISNC